MKTKTRVVVIGGQKGGTGKSTLAQNLAVACALEGGDVMLIDTDTPQNTSNKWQLERGEAKLGLALHSSIHKGRGVGDAIDDYKKRYSHIVVDTGGADSDELRVALIRADVLVTPFQPNQADMWTVEKMNKLVADARVVNPKLRAIAVVSNAPGNPRVGEPASAAVYLEDFEELTLAQAIVRNRMTYPRALAQGRGALEYEPVDEKAREEINTLYAEVFK